METVTISRMRGRAARRAGATACIAALVAILAAATPGCEPILGDWGPRDPRTDANAPGSAHALCNARSARVARCDAARAPGVAGTCSAIHDTHVLRADWVRAEIRCLANQACEVDDDCELVGYRAIGVGPENWPPVVRRCIQMGDICGGSFATCRQLTALTDGVRAEALRCFSTSTCDDYAACFHAFLSSRLEPAMPSR